MPLRTALNYSILAIMLLAFMELSAHALILVSRPLFSEPIRTTDDIYREQSEHIRSWIEADGRGRDVVDTDLGWRYRAGFQGRRNAINSQGLRSAREFTVTAPEGVIRVAAFGDSFVYGNEVANEHAWATVVDTSFDDIEVLNYGVGGYGVDQSLLKYRVEGGALSPHVVLIGFIADDIRRVVNVYQRFASTSSGTFTKPRFALGEGGELQLVPPPIRRLEDWIPILENPSLVTDWGEHDQWYEPLVYENPLYDLSAAVRLATNIWSRLDNRYLDPDRLFIGNDFNTSAVGYRLQMAIFDAFVEDVQDSGAYPVVLILPSRGELQSAFGGETIVYAPLIEELDRLGIVYWEASEAFLARGKSGIDGSWFAPGGHYSPLGNRIVADWLAPKIRTLKGELLGSPGN